MVGVEIELRRGNIYFLVGFYDTELVVPCISTFVYEGYDDTDGHLFRDAKSYIEIQEGQAPGAGHYVCFPENGIHGILDTEHLVNWLQDKHGTKAVGKTYDYRVVK